MTNYKDYYYKYKALKYYLKNKKKEQIKGGSDKPTKRYKHSHPGTIEEVKNDVTTDNVMEQHDALTKESILKQILTFSNCDEISKFIRSNTVNPNLLLDEKYFITLINNIEIENFPKILESSDDDDDDDILEGFYPSIQINDDEQLLEEKLHEYFNFFRKKCLHKHLITKYTKMLSENIQNKVNEAIENDKWKIILEECWYQAIRESNVDDYKYFNYLVDTTIINDGVFQNNKLTKVIIPNSVETIGISAFQRSQLTSVYIPNSVETIGHYAFAYNKLTEVIIPNSVKTIGFHAFINNQLTSVTISDSVKKLDYLVFAYNQLKTVNIPNSVETIGFMVFTGNQLEGTLIIPNSVKTIRSNAFQNNKLTKVIIPNSVETIDSYAFNNNNIKIVDIPNSVEIKPSSFDKNTTINRTQ